MFSQGRKYRSVDGRLRGVEVTTVGAPARERWRWASSAGGLYDDDGIRYGSCGAEDDRLVPEVAVGDELLFNDRRVTVLAVDNEVAWVRVESGDRWTVRTTTLRPLPPPAPAPPPAEVWVNLYRRPDGTVCSSVHETELSAAGADYYRVTFLCTRKVVLP